MSSCNSQECLLSLNTLFIVVHCCLHKSVEGPFMNVPFVNGNLLKKTMVQVRIQKLKKQGTKRIKDNPMIEEVYFHPKA